MLPLNPAAIAAAAALVVGIGIGATGATWRADAACATQKLVLVGNIATLKDEKHALELGVAEANKAVAVAAAQTEAADAARENAQRHAADLAQFSKSRLDRLAKGFETATSCDAVLRGYWEMRK